TAEVMFFQAFIHEDVNTSPENSNGHSDSAALTNSAAGSEHNHQEHKFTNPFGACNFIVTWDGEDVEELLSAIRCARQSTDRFIQDKLIEYILNIPYRNPRPTDIPAFSGRPVWAVDRHGHALVGMPGNESIVQAETLRRTP